MVEEKEILVVDDEQVILDAINRIASAEGINVDTETNGKAALKKVSQKSYSLLLCDILMPEMDGFMILDELHKMKKQIPIIMITGFSTVENAVKSISKGAIDFVSKPFTFEELESAISRGLAYNKLLIKLEGIKSKKNNSDIGFVPCPPKYHRLGNHSWVNQESEGIIILGATNLYLEIIKDLKSINMIESDQRLIQGESCAEFITKDDLAHHFLSPVSGRIFERNEKLLTEINLLQKDPYFGGWIYKVIPEDIEYDMKYLTPCASDRM
ncbi:MAG: response regulator [Ignavibacteria bacterium]|nr:response regulator [Ignavibacteria bacterium]MBT8381707.1 response regulator [Ignavibacteria bacterium]MBT8392839.1 response regulator [Ignavibacteria bacterium]NNJ52138.1 response regulator [Ignavibacteriaceae bacterium]NNL20224.1 response regulator [Ignavibacteriaceae bacterium]